MPRKLTKEEFEERARKLHGDKYGYDYVNYVNNQKKVTVVCPEHGPFEQRPGDHLRGNGCSSCNYAEKSKTNRKAEKEFIEESKKVHGDWYGYKKVNYVNNKTEVTITCPIHGDFEQRPDNHLNGQGCSRCARVNKSTKDEFEQKARQVHGNKYNYDRVDYVNTMTLVTIVCPEHGPFPQTPNSHLNGIGCPDCGGTKRSTRQRFIDEATLIHGGKYDYKKIDYKNNRTPVTIICPEHGSFQQTPNRHLNGRGCPECAKEKVGFWNPGFIRKYRLNQMNSPCTLYVIECCSENEQFIKVGITSRTIEERYHSTQSLLNGYGYNKIYEHHSTLIECSELEQEILKQFKEYRYEPEFSFDGSSECLTHEALDGLMELLDKVWER